MKRQLILFSIIILTLVGCNFSQPTQQPTVTPRQLTPIPRQPTLESTSTATIAPTADDTSLEYFPSKVKFQVFILNPVRACLAGNDFASGNVCYGEKCGDCDCRWEDFDPPAPMLGIRPDEIDNPKYDAYEHKICMEISLTPEEVEDIKEDMLKVSELVYEWSEGALELQMSFTELAHDYEGFVAPDFAFGPFEVDDELLNPYVGIDTDFVYVVAGVRDRTQNLNLAYWCGGSYGEMSVHGAGYSYIQYNDMCNSVYIDGRMIYEPLIHEWYHNLDWALYHINQVPDIYEGFGPDWANWKRASWPACDSTVDPLKWFPSIDYCEWDPGWIDCNNTASKGKCVHAGELDRNMSWYEYVIRAHYPRTIQYIGNYCRDGRQDFSETGVDSGWPCP